MNVRAHRLLHLLLLAGIAISSQRVAAETLITHELSKVIAGDGVKDELFGRAVGLNGDTLIVSAPLVNDSGNNSGAVYVYERLQGSNENWNEVAKLIPDDGALGDNFGIFVAIDADTLVAGTHLDDDNGIDSGSAYIFERDPGGNDTWSQVAKLLASDGAAGDWFGWSVAISGDTVAISAHYDDDNGIDSGAAYIFERDAGGAENWGQVAKLIASDGLEGDKFAFQVAVSGDTVVAGAVWDDDNDHNSGSAYIFERDTGGNDNWGEVAKLTASDSASDDVFGNHVEISGDTIVVGANLNDAVGVDSGAAYVFERDAGGSNNWGEVAKLIASDGDPGDWLGGWVDIDGDTVVVSTTFDDVSGKDSGSAYVFKRDAGGPNNWGEVTKLTASDGVAIDWFGFTAEVSEDTVVVGAPLDDDNDTDSGSVYVFNLSTVPADLVQEGSGDVVGENITHANGNIYNQVLLTGQSVTLRTDGSEITRVSFLDLNDDIVQVEFSGSAIVTVTLDPDTFEEAAPPTKYNQPTVNYVKGRPNVRVEGADENTFLSIFTVGSINAFNQGLFPDGETYDAMADVALLEITNSTGFGGILCANTRFNHVTGETGIKAPGVPVSLRAIIGDIDASGDAVPHLILGEGSSLIQYDGALIIAGGDLLQSNEANVLVALGADDTGFSSIISQDNFKSDSTNIPAASIQATFENAANEIIDIPLFRKILEVNGIALSIDSAAPDTVSITADGMVTTSGWTNPMLVDFNFNNPTAEGIFNYEFIAESPVGPVLTVISPISITLDLNIPPSQINGVKVHAVNNSIETLLDTNEN
jgi:hypothetical protein